MQNARKCVFLGVILQNFPGDMPTEPPRMVVSSALPLKLFYYVTRLWRHVVVTKLGHPLGNFLRTPLISIRAPPPTENGTIAQRYLRLLTTNKAVRTFDVIDKDGQYYRGKSKVDIDRNDLIIDDKRYSGTQGLCDFIVMKNPEVGFATEEDKKNYEEIMVNSGAMRHPNHPDKPFANIGYRWQTVMKPIWSEHVKKNKTKIKASTEKR